MSFEINAHEVTVSVIIDRNKNYTVSCCIAKHSVFNLAYCFNEKRDT